jgi:hypothetical protein
VEKEMRFDLKLIENSNQIQNMILDNLLLMIEPVIQQSIPGIQKKIVDLAISKIKAEPEYDALLNGQLRLEFGIPNPTTMVDVIIGMWANNIVVNQTPFRKTKSGISGSFSINMIKDDFSDVLAFTSASTVYDTSSGAELPWLQWLLLDGSKILVRNHYVKIGPNRNSRTGMAVMAESKSQNWRVPSEYAGTKNNNWVTRALSTINNEISDIIEKEIVSNI